MIKRKEQMPVEIRENLRGGHGKLQFTHLFQGDELNKTNMFAVITIQPGDSIGVHPHNPDGEAYVVLDGSITVTEDGVDYILHAGDAEYCSDGNTHAVVNHTDKPATFLAIVIK